MEPWSGRDNDSSDWEDENSANFRVREGRNNWNNCMKMCEIMCWELERCSQQHLIMKRETAESKKDYSKAVVIS